MSKYYEIVVEEIRILRFKGIVEASTEAEASDLTLEMGWYEEFEDIKDSVDGTRTVKVEAIDPQSGGHNRAKE